MTSTCSQSATAATAAASSASLAKSAARMLGAICTVISAASVGLACQTGCAARAAPDRARRKCRSPRLSFDLVFEPPDRQGGRDLTPEAPSRLLDRVRKLLAKAEDESVTPPEAQALTAKAAELMAKYGIDRALLAADRPETDHPDNRIVDIGNPWARVQAHLLCGLASAMRCQCVVLPRADPGARIHMFGFASHIERGDILFTSLLVQMWQGLAATDPPSWS